MVMKHYPAQFKADAVALYRCGPPAAGLHAWREEVAGIPINLVLLRVAAVIAWGRFGRTRTDQHNCNHPGWARGPASFSEE